MNRGILIEVRVWGLAFWGSEQRYCHGVSRLEGLGVNVGAVIGVYMDFVRTIRSSTPPHLSFSKNGRHRGGVQLWVIGVYGL